MPLRSAFVAGALSVLSPLAQAPSLPEGAPVEGRPPDLAAELRVAASPPAWSADVVNAVMGEGVTAQTERQSGWLAPAERWLAVDYVDRAFNYASHGWLAHRGIAFEHYGFNEYQETIHLRPETAVALFGERGLARGPMGELVIDPIQTMSGHAYMADPIEPRWAAVLGYDQAVSPLFADAISQDNLGGAAWGTGPSSLGCYSDAAARGFAAWRARHGEPAVAPIRDYLRERWGDRLGELEPYRKPAGADFRGANALAQELCRDPVFAEFLLYRHAANIGVWRGLYTNLRRVAARAGREFDAHGNLGGAPPGPDSYPVSLAPYVDTVWFETSGLAQYDQFLHGWWDAYGALRLELALASARPGRPVMFLVQPQKKTPDLVAHELAEISAGGGVPLAYVDMLATQAPDALPAVSALYALRDRHRAVYQARGRERLADVALLYSVPTMLFDQCVPGVSTGDSPAQNDFASAARALEDGHVPYDVVVLRHPELTPQGLSERELARYRVVIAPSLESLSDADLARLARYLRSGGTLAVIGKLGLRDPRNRTRGGDSLAALRAAGRVVPLLAGASFPASRSGGSAGRTLGARLLSELAPLLPEPRVTGTLAPDTWVSTWRHDGGFVSAHFVSYALDFTSGKARPVPAAVFRLRLPNDVRAEQARWLAPGEPERDLPLAVRGGVAEVTLPELHVYGVLVLGPAGAEQRASALTRGDRRLARARSAGAGVADLGSRLGAVQALRGRDPNGYDAAAGKLLESLAGEQEQAYLGGIRELASFGEPVAAFAFAQNADHPPWRAVRADTEYSKTLGFGWLPRDDDARATPEEKDYTGTLDQGPDELASASLFAPYWPYPGAALPAPISSALLSGPSRVFRVDLPDGDYRVSVVEANAGWPRMNLLVSGMVTANGRVVLLDTPLDKGSLVRRRFTTHVDGGALELRFGGATGFGLAGLLVERAPQLEPDPLAAGGVRSFRLSPRHPNPDWLPLEDLVVPQDAAGSERTAAAGIPVVDLGVLDPAAIGDVVVARAEIQRASAGSAELHVGSSSAARVYLNGALVLDLPNVKGIEADEGVARVPLRAGANQLEVVLERFWERRWLFFASLL
ncbi:MAG TPA: hypothetical protein VMR50_04325 [Myxococcota bacterium]|nr:hypothetical protein [Myxococcota bacterium]